MGNLAKACTALAIVGFVMAVVTSFTGPIVAAPETYSRASTNLALIAICLFMGFGDGEKPAA